MADCAESIYNLVPERKLAQSKATRYTSTFRRMVKDEYRAQKDGSKTMGPAKLPLSSTKDFLKKCSGEHKLQTTEKPPKVSPTSGGSPKSKKPSVPTRKDQPVMGVKSNKNFVKTNAIENMLIAPKKPMERYADTVTGAIHDLAPSGLIPNYVKKTEYGKVPEYLTKRKQEIEEATREYEEYVRMRQQEGALKEVSGEEREAILEGLKRNWEEVHHQYQGLSVVADTAPKKGRKERMEAEMKQLEKDIEMIERHRVIYIAADSY
eukprot:m.91348 g.91348  ORF g.91348 m.91348 type:complete len:264 (+) comp36682_c0_seq2:62-853(+)